MAITSSGASNYVEMVNPIVPVHLMGNKAEFDDFIAIWPNFVPQAFCNDIIGFHNRWEEQAVERNMSGDLQKINICDGDENSMAGVAQFGNKGLGRRDYSIMLDNMDSQLSARINQYLQTCINHYCAEYSSLTQIPLTSFAIKCQKTPEGGGYHVWHHEDGSYGEHARCAVWMIYLNEDFEGGETEFFYQKRRIKPSTGTVVIWPAGYTHSHKGNLVLKGTKYIVTGWFYQQPV
tara:strand:+ start:16618 stop:17319 length:702 start_codon:yes stop_codon:yes gene_type:complete